MADESVERLEPRLIQVEAKVENLVSQNIEIKAELRALNAKTDALRDKMEERFAKMDEKLNDRFTDLVKRLGEQKVWTLVVVGGGVLSILAHALHWL